MCESTVPTADTCVTRVPFALCLRNKPGRLTALFVTLVSPLRKIREVGTHPDARLGVVGRPHGGVHFMVAVASQ